MPANCAVAFADRRELPLGQWERLLTVREQKEVSCYRHPARFERTIASRMLAKFLLTQPKPSEFQRMGAREIKAVENSKWRTLELLSGPSETRTGAKIFRGGEACEVFSASASHCGVYSASCVSRHHVGLDLERIEARRQEFYKQSFSPEEQQWVATKGEQDGRSIDTLFTLLWSVKEAYLKASGNRGLSVWAFPRWTVWFEEPIAELLRQNEDERFLKFSGGIRTPGFSHAFEIAAMRIGEMTLVTVEYPKVMGEE